MIPVPVGKIKENTRVSALPRALARCSSFHEIMNNEQRAEAALSVGLGLDRTLRFPHNRLLGLHIVDDFDRESILAAVVENHAKDV